jgi:hypothetical protein
VLGVLGVAAVALGIRSAAGMLAAATLLVSYAGLVAVYVDTPFRSVDAHLDHSARRIVTSLVLFAAVLAPALLAREADQSSS